MSYEAGGDGWTRDYRGDSYRGGIGRHYVVMGILKCAIGIAGIVSHGCGV